ncbi:PAQR family membrane homeostasis protein TrhA [Estrella lausannensis]|uniref:Conserved putative membrane protein n=1 Tax=Estrella lausannensis TaxID=483423 RepID=A0A0H5DN57_9BACT|nr:hemolysin III family protein [Estrella lausannensis]CRX37686.1 Conserved putative membrane protein [Estrella lausannensis]
MYPGERFNSISHLIGAVLALVGFGALLTVALQHHDIWMLTSYSIFGFTLILLYTASTLYHSFHPPKLKRIFQKLDHASIYLLIAGTYTPYCLLPLRDTSGPFVLTIIWSLAIFGILIDTLSAKRREVVQISIYLIMGWFAITEFDQILAKIPFPGVVWLTIGGVAYTLGIIFYILSHHQMLKHSHGIWHIFVLTASICHFISIIGYVH